MGKPMKLPDEIPLFDDHLPFLNQFILGLVEEFKAGNIKSWDKLEQRVKMFFTPEMTDRVGSIVPDWHKMASYADGTTLVHVMCAFMGLYMMPEFLDMTKEHQQVMKWIILFHDIEKELEQGKRDYLHAFRSAVNAAKTLPFVGFPITPEYETIIGGWSDFTISARTTAGNPSMEVQDNRKLPEILDGIERMFGHNTPAALIVKTILFHLSVDMNDWPPPNPLTEEEVIRYFDRELILPLKVMHLADGDGWSMFKPEVKKHQRMDTIEVFYKIDLLLAQ